MDALRKAEQQKQEGAVPEQSPRQQGVSAKLALEPLSAPVGSESGSNPAQAVAADETAKAGSIRLPELPTRLEDLDAQFVTPAGRSPQAARPAATARKTAPAAAPESSKSNSDAARETARTLFAAKHPAPKDSRNFAIAVGALTLIATVGIGGYFWWQMDQMGQPKGGLVASGGAGAPLSATATQLQSAAAPAPMAVVATPANAVPTVGGVPAAAVPPAPTFTAPATTKPAPAQNPIRVTAAPQKTNPLLEQAFAAFNRGDIPLAQSAWLRTLETDPKNSDALYGLAAVALQQQQPNQAAEFYLRALEANPKDALALSGLINLKGHGDPQQTESRLKNLLAEQPDSPFLNFALGNLYARNALWGDAQQAYFKAHVADPANPDYLFNLAVSLDQLRQGRLAIQYYNQALAAAVRQPAGFDPAQVAVRLKTLQSPQQP
ncbi:MAG: tetratricopeptide repeat protein [Rhodocyclaceae bacterium]|nr:tetratricopeptide repeat protein [Rhodocyclaceae bacterium]